MQKIHLTEVRSTNSWVLDALSEGQNLGDETVVYTLRQTAGRGQMGNGWESEADQNIAFSMLLHPTFLPIRNQFVISEICCVGVLLALEELAQSQGLDPAEKGFSIKWPNDIYAGDKKLAGILIENRLMSSCFESCVLGVGLNVNQTRWIGNAPNPVSLKALGIYTDPLSVLDLAVTHISRLYHLLHADVQAASRQIHAEFQRRLYRAVGYHPYYDPRSDEHFEACLMGVDPQGPLSLQLQGGEIRRYWFKEVRFVLPCGVTKE